MKSLMLTGSIGRDFALGAIGSLIGGVLVAWAAWWMSWRREKWRWQRDRQIEALQTLLEASNDFFDLVNRIYRRMVPKVTQASTDLLPLVAKVQLRHAQLEVVAPEEINKAASLLRDEHDRFARWILNESAEGKDISADPEEFQRQFDPLSRASKEFIAAARKSLME